MNRTARRRRARTLGSRYARRVRSADFVSSCVLAALVTHCAAVPLMQERDADIVKERCIALAERGSAAAMATSRTHVSITSELSSRFDVDRVCIAADEQAAVELPRRQVDEVGAHKVVTVDLPTATPARVMTVYVQLRDHATRQYRWAMPGHHDLAPTNTSDRRVSVTVYETEREPWDERPTLKWSDPAGD